MSNRNHVVAEFQAFARRAIWQPRLCSASDSKDRNGRQDNYVMSHRFLRRDILPITKIAEDRPLPEGEGGSSTDSPVLSYPSDIVQAWLSQFRCSEAGAAATRLS